MKHDNPDINLTTYRDLAEYLNDMSDEELGQRVVIFDVDEDGDKLSSYELSAIEKKAITSFNGQEKVSNSLLITQQ